MTGGSRAWWEIALDWPFISGVLIIVALVIVLILVCWLYFVVLHGIIWLKWCGRGHDILFVTSNSPIWQDYIERNILPHIRTRAVVLNWSERKQWRFSLARTAFHQFGGAREFNPLAVVFHPFRRTRTFRFWLPFRDFKHGDPEALHRMENEFFGLIGIERSAEAKSRERQK